jgi:tyrosinase
VAAVLALKAVPSPYDAQLSYYDQFVAWHLSLYPCGMGHETAHAHGGPMFLPWHRLFLLHFENALREVSGKRITVPYWDWTDPASTPDVFAEDFMGGDGDPDEGFAVTTGPFRKGRWELRVHPIGVQWSASATDHLTRRFGSFPPMPTLPTPEDVAFVLGRPKYDVAPFDGGSDPSLSFRNALEGFWRSVGPVRLATGSASMVCGPDGVMMVTSGESAHNRVHGWVGGLLGTTPEGIKVLGTMGLPTSPNDPVFFLHHANIDRLWAEWQRVHGVDSYEPASCGQQALELGCRGNTRTDRMHPPFEATPADVADIGALGYRYDTTSGRRRGTARPGAAPEALADSAFLCEIPRPAGSGS